MYRTLELASRTFVTLSVIQLPTLFFTPKIQWTPLAALAFPLKNLQYFPANVILSTKNFSNQFGNIDSSTQYFSNHLANILFHHTGNVFSIQKLSCNTPGN